jgi:hypothetical protein
MKHIDTTAIIKPANWLRDARKFNRILKKKSTTTEKKNYITSKSAFWGKFKPQLEILSNERCWFTESPDWVSPFHVEHFKPKGKVDPLKVDLKFTEFTRADWSLGYWWLAFNWKNYKLACFALNTSNKQNYFPLGPASTSAVNPSQNHSAETHVLIDPCIAQDVDLITYNMWEVVETADKTTQLSEFERARVSIEVYGLNKIEKLVNQRKTVLGTCNKHLKRANEKFDEFQNFADQYSLEYLRIFKYFNDDCEDLKEMIDYSNKGALFPTMVINRIKSSGYKWVNDFILN